MRRTFHWLKLSVGWVAVLSGAISAMAVSGGLHLHPFILVPAIVVTGLTIATYLVLGFVADARLTWWSWRWWLWFRKTGKTLALRDQRRSDGLCPTCAYDLTGNLSGVCPECGEPARTGSV